MATSPLFFIGGTTGRTATLSYRFFDVNGDWVGAAITAGIFEQDALKGTYGVAAATIPPTARGVHWQDSGIASLQGDEIFPATGYATDVDALLHAGPGAFPITVTVTDGTDPLQNAIVSLYDGVLLAGRLTTDASGNATFSLDTGSYEAAVVKGGYQMTPVIRTVTGNQAGTLTDDLEMTGTTPVPPPDPELCRIFGTILLPSGQPAVNARVDVTLVANRAVGTLGGSVIANRTVSENTNDVGYVEIDVVRTDQINPTPTYSLRCQQAGLELANLSLTSATVDIADLLP